MEQITIALPPEVATQLRSTAKNLGIEPEDLLLASLQEKLAKLDAEFLDAMKYVLKKNAELYQRLA